MFKKEKTIRETKLTVNLTKYQFAQTHMKCLGHIFSGDIRMPVENKIGPVLVFPIRAFQVLAGYYMHRVTKFFVIASSLTNSLRGNLKEKIHSLD